MSVSDLPSKVMISYRFQIFMSRINPLPDDKILEMSKLKQIADDILKCIENKKISTIEGRKHCEKRKK